MNGFIKYLGYKFARTFCMIVVLLPTVLLTTELFSLSEKTGIGFLNVLAVIVSVFGLFTVIFTVNEVMMRMKDVPSLSFFDAVALTYRGYFLLLSFMLNIRPPRREEKPGRVTDQKTDE